MKTERRHELETNQLANSLGHWADAVRPHANTILAAILAVIMAGAVYLFAQRRTATTNAEAWDEFFTALGRQRPDRLKLEEIGEIHARTPVGWWSMCMAADIGLNEGSNVLYRDKAAARDILTIAVNHYQQILEETREPALLQRALFGKARAHECLGEIKKALDEYQNVAAKWPGTPFAAAAEKRAKDLQRLDTREFYDWFAKQDIGKRISPNPGTPGLKLPYNWDSLPDSSEKSGTPPGDEATPGPSATSDAPAATTSETTTDGPSSGTQPTGTQPTGTQPTGEKDAGRK